VAKLIRFALSAVRDLRRHSNRADLIRRKIDAYAADPASQTNNVKTLKGGGLRLGVGDYRVIFEETADEIVISKIGPRGDVYDD
jgi:mRNA interferase RelE/StbE